MVACDQSVGPATTGSITIRLLVPAATSLVPPASAPSSNAPAAVTLESIRVSVSGGPTPKTQAFACSATLCEGTVEGLDPGSYTVTVEGLVSSQVTYYGKATGVGVTAGTNTSTSVTFQNFQPTLNSFAPDTTTALTFTVSYSAVPGADSYIIEWSKASDFSGSTSAAANGTTATITVTDVGTYYVRVKAVNATVTSGGRPSDPKTIAVTTDQVPSGDDATSAPLLSPTWNYTGTIAKLNVFPQTDSDWFKFQACTNDTVTIETFAARLTPPSALNTQLQLRNVSGAQIASNDDATGTTDSRIQQVITTDGAYYAQVSGVGNTVGKYDLTVNVRAGSKNVGSKCTTTKQVMLSAPQDTLVALGDNMQLTATALDTTGTPVTGATFTWSSSNSAVLSVNQSGLVTAVANGNATITATESSVPGQRTIAVAQAVASVTVSPATATIATGATQQFTATALDALSNTVTGVTFFWASNNPAVAVVDTTGLATGIGGGTATITAVGRGQPGNARLTVGAQVATQLAFTVQPSNITAGAAISPAVQVEIRDAGGNRVTGAQNAVTLAIGTNPPGDGTLLGTATVNALSGVATFSGLSIDKAGTGYTLTASSSGLTAATSTTFNVTAQVATQLLFSVQPSNSTAGDAISPAIQVEIRDATNKLVTAARDAVTVAIGTNPGSGTLAGTKTVNAVNGIASFSGLWINKAGTGYTLAANSGSLTGATSTGFNITPGAPAKLGFSAQPSNVEGNVVISPQVQVTIRDLYDNVVTTATDQVTVSLASNPWKTPFSNGASLSGTLANFATAGVATFNNLRIDKPAPGFTLAAASGTLTGATSSAFNVNLTVQQVSASTNGSHTCAVTTGGTYCWGYNGNGQLGIPTTSYQDSVAALVRGGLTFVQVTTGAYHSCGITSGGAAYCWGYNGEGQLGNNTTTDSDVPVAVSGGHVFAQIDAGYLHTCAVTTANATYSENQRVFCWGYDYYGTLGDGAAVPGAAHKLVPTGADTTLLKTAASVSAGAYHTCARAAGVGGGAAYCWGYDYYGQLGDAGDIQAAPPKSVPTLVLGGFTNWTLMTAGYLHTCGLRATGEAMCWGYGGYGEIGNQTNGTTSSSDSIPRTVYGSSGGSPLNFVSLSAGGYHSCAVTNTGVGYCWGNNGDGELGDGNYPTNNNQPVTVAGGLTFAATGIDAGQYHSCARTTAPVAGVYCWGAGYNGQLGNGATGSFQKTPVQIKQ